MHEIENPSIARINSTGYDFGCEPKEKEMRCPICDKEYEKLYFNKHWGEVVGCDNCVKIRWWDDDET